MAQKAFVERVRCSASKTECGFWHFGTSAFILLAQLKFPGVTSNYPFKVVNGKNDAVEMYKKGTSIEAMAKKCYETCKAFNCLAFEVCVVWLRTCKPPCINYL
jgi:hypothetical protein